MNLSFEQLGLEPELVRAVEGLGFQQPTPIQQSAIPALLEGRDVLGQAQTGTGKTAAFALPLLQALEPHMKLPQALVLAPTRELAMQVSEAAGRLSGEKHARVLAVYGGTPYSTQIRALRRGVDVVVGTPGRLLDLLKRGVLDLSQASYIVLDEADEMLEMGFIEDVEAILAQVPEIRQTSLFSATLPQAVRKLAERYLSEPQEIQINPSQRTVAETEQRFVRVREEQKLESLARLLEAEEVKSALIFARTKARAQELADDLARRGYPVAALHGDLNQARREQVLANFRQGQISLLVATDVAARGLDIEDVSHVINYDIPGEAGDYVHRIGRTGRAGRKGMAITFVQPRERRRLGEIETYTRQGLVEMAVPGRAQIQAQRDERFTTRLGEELCQENLGGERAIAERLAQSGFDPLEIAAAAIRMARQGEAALPADDILPKPVRETSYADQRKPFSDARGGKRPAAGRERREQAGMVRLWMNLGDTNGIRPGDVVGAIAGEVGIPGRAIGEIDIHRDYTLVDVAEKHARQVLKQSEGSYRLRGKPVVIRKLTGRGL